MNKPIQLYVTYIAAPPQKIWDALTDGALTQQYFFGRRVESDWKVGSTWTLWMPDGRVDCRGKVLESISPKRLVLDWTVMWIEEMSKLPPTIVTYTIEPFGEATRLTVYETHDPAIPEQYKEGGKLGWPVILCGLKSLVETGKPLPAFDMSLLMPKPE